MKLQIPKPKQKWLLNNNIVETIVEYFNHDYYGDCYKVRHDNGGHHYEQINLIYHTMMNYKWKKL